MGGGGGGGGGELVRLMCSGVPGHMWRSGTFSEMCKLIFSPHVSERTTCHNVW